MENDVVQRKKYENTSCYDKNDVITLNMLVSVVGEMICFYEELKLCDEKYKMLSSDEIKLMALKSVDKYVLNDDCSSISNNHFFRDKVCNEHFNLKLLRFFVKYELNYNLDNLSSLYSFYCDHLKNESIWKNKILEEKKNLLRSVNSIGVFNVHTDDLDQFFNIAESLKNGCNVAADLNYYSFLDIININGVDYFITYDLSNDKYPINVYEISKFKFKNFNSVTGIYIGSNEYICGIVKELLCIPDNLSLIKKDKNNILSIIFFESLFITFTILI